MLPVASSLSERFFQILCASQNVQTLLGQVFLKIDRLHFQVAKFQSFDCDSLTLKKRSQVSQKGKIKDHCTALFWLMHAYKSFASMHLSQFLLRVKLRPQIKSFLDGCYVRSNLCKHVCIILPFQKGAVHKLCCFKIGDF